jgi:hypothetical protein
LAATDDKYVKAPVFGHLGSFAEQAVPVIDDQVKRERAQYDAH